MGKSVTATLVGILIGEGALRLDQPAPVAEWRGPDDPRAAITVADLLRMSSGLRFSFTEPSLARLFWRGIPDHIRVYTGLRDVFRFAIDAPAEHPPGRVGRYRNSDPLVLGAIARRIVEARGDDYLLWPQRALFDQIGIRRQVLETDAEGNFILTGYDYGTARSWARLGLLYLWEGIWLGRRLLPAEFVRFASTPAPAWEEPVYGGLFWLNRTGRVPLPKDAFWMGGDGVQRVTVVPSLNLVVVRLGHVAGGDTAEASHARALEGVAAAVKAAGAPSP
jgi:CubicO group peptidase (beta-lactamase class C family)